MCASNPSGILPQQQLKTLVDEGQIKSPPLDVDQLQPNSLDLRVGKIAYRARFSFLPTDRPIATMLEGSDLTLDTLDLDGPEGAILETGKVYIIPLQESLALPAACKGTTNPKSSTGRLDILARVLVDRTSRFDEIPAGYAGPLYLEVVPRSFPVRMRKGDRLSQLRLAHGNWSQLTDDELRSEIEQHGLVCTDSGQPIAADQLSLDDGVFLTAHVTDPEVSTVGYVARKCTPAVDLRRKDHPPQPYWRGVSSAQDGAGIVLQPDEFYIFSSRERVVIPPHLCAEMVAYDSRSGELRTHYAGFFDSGFGYQCGGARVVLEVRNLDVPFLLQDGQRLFRLQYFKNAACPEALYGSGETSHYQAQGLRLSKHFGQGDANQLALW